MSEKETGNFLPSVISFDESANEKLHLKGEFFKQDYPCYCLNIFLSEFVVLIGFIGVGLIFKRHYLS